VQSNQRRWLAWLPVLVLFLAFILRVYRLGDQNVWWDEGYSVWVARHDLGTLTSIAAGDTHPPLYYWLLHPWMLATGPSEFAIRFPSLMFGVIAVALVYRLGRYLTNGERPALSETRGRGAKAVGIASLAALLLAVSRFHIWWSQEIRMYSLAAMWGVASSLALLMALRARTARWWAAYLLTTIAGMYSLYLFAFVLAAQNVFILWWWLWRLRNKLPVTRHQVGGWIGIQAMVALAMLPWLAYTLPRLKSWSAASQFSTLTYLQLYWTVLTLGITTFVERYWAANLLVLGVIVVGIVVWRRNAIHNTQHEPGILHLASCLLLVPALGLFILLSLPQGLFYRPPLEARYQLLSVPALALMLAISIAALWEWRKVVGAIAGVAILALTLWVLPGYYDGRHLRDDFQTMTRAVAAYAEPGDALLLVSGDRFPLFQFRYDVLPNRAQLPDVTTLSVVKVMPQDVEQFLLPLAASHKRVWLAEVEKNLQDPDGLLAGWLDKNRNVVWREDYGYNRLSLYSLDDQLPAVTGNGGEFTAWRGDSIGALPISSYDISPRNAGPGDVVHLIVYLPVSQSLTLTASLYRRDGLGTGGLESHDQQVSPPRQGLARVRFDVPIYSCTPSGEYYFQLFAPWRIIVLDTSLRIGGTSPLETVTSIPNQRDDRIGQSIHLKGYQAPAQVKPGGELPVKLYWQISQGKPEERYTVFVQLVGTQYNPKTNGPLWAGHDSEPLNGGYPTTQWFVDVPIADTHVLAVPPDAPPGDYELWAGMYTQPDIKRLPVYDRQGDLVGDHVVLGKVKVIGK
jgi:4-amino-4-deoxy-L-arabinose transferase-like glycosyltransferase